MEDWEQLLCRQGLGIYRGAAGKRNRQFFPGEEFPDRGMAAPGKDYRVDWTRLTEREQEVILRLYYDRQSEREIAEVLGLSRSSVRVYHRRALEKLGKEGGIRVG